MDRAGLLDRPKTCFLYAARSRLPAYEAVTADAVAG